MPTYGYECKSCGHTFDVFQNMSDAPLKVCPQCGRELRRLINGGTGIIFKGSGFYVTDKNKNPAGTSSKAKKSDKPPAPADTSVKTEGPGSAPEAGKPAESKPKAEAGKV
jgi:putative FmdB family regulatory protein